MTGAREGERVAYFNGEIIPESEVKVPFRDRGFKYGDAVFDMTRTFGHKIFKLETHISRFYNSLKYVDIDPGMTEAEMVAKTREVLEANLHLLGPDEDFWVGQRISRGVDLVGGDMWETAGGPNVIIECAPLPLKPRARLYKDGIDVLVPSVRRTPPESLSPRAKSHNYLNLIYTPQEQYVLGGISRETAIEMAERLDIPVVTKDIDMFDAMTADEIFLTSTSLCICGVRSFQGRQIGDGTAAGPITKALMNEYVDFVEYDWLGQYLKRLED